MNRRRITWPALAEPDTRIASIALSRGLTLVTGNVRNFDRVPDLTVENWLGGPRRTRQLSR